MYAIRERFRATIGSLIHVYEFARSNPPFCLLSFTDLLYTKTILINPLVPKGSLFDEVTIGH